MYVVTGAAGFIGSSLCERLLALGHRVRGLDSFTSFYDPHEKLRNVECILDDDRFDLVVGAIDDVDLGEVVEGADAVFHLAAQPGVRPSWGTGFEGYVVNNVLATQKLLEACRRARIPKIVYASSSSVYGEEPVAPTPEDVPLRPISPYGVTKCAGEQLCEAYRVGYGLPVTSLRLFTVYGPRQRPDMALSRLVQAALTGRPFIRNGDGNQRRDFTFVGDIVEAFVRAARTDWSGVANAGAGRPVTLNDAIRCVERHCGPVELVETKVATGDPAATFADISLASDVLGYQPSTQLDAGVAAMAAWARGRPLATAGGPR